MRILEFNKDNYKLGILTKFCGLDCETKEAFKIGNQMLQIMIEHKGIGLAANQVGYLIPLIVMYVNEKPTILWKSNILKIGTSQEFGLEGCLSLPSVKIEIERPTDITISAIVSKQGKRKTIKLEGLDARCFMHEYNHIQGKTILD